jgi:hypothetical protein
MMEYLESNNILCEMQHGFRSNRSRESQIISLGHQLAQNNDKNIQTDLICDSRDLFDLKPCCISHKMLFDSRYSIILLAITCSRSLQEIQVRDIGL